MLLVPKISNNLLVQIFTTRGASDPNDAGMVESGLSIYFIWHLANSNQTYGYGDMGGWENSRTAAAGAAAAAGGAAAAAAAAA